MIEDFEGALQDVFDGREGQFSDELRGTLRLLWATGVRLGLFLERERKPVPPGIFEKPPRRPARNDDDDPRRTPGKVEQLRKARDELVEKAEELALEIERQLDYEPTLALGGDELAKARHRFLGQVHHIDGELERLLEQVRKFRVHSY